MIEICWWLFQSQCFEADDLLVLLDFEYFGSISGWITNLQNCLPFFAKKFKSTCESSPIPIRRITVVKFYLRDFWWFGNHRYCLILPVVHFGLLSGWDKNVKPCIFICAPRASCDLQGSFLRSWQPFDIVLSWVFPVSKTDWFSCWQLFSEPDWHSNLNLTEPIRSNAIIEAPVEDLVQRRVIKVIKDFHYHLTAKEIPEVLLSPTCFELEANFSQHAFGCVFLISERFLHRLN